MFKNKKIFILGMARSGYEAAKLLARRGNEIVINDLSDKQDPKQIEELQALGVEIVLGSHPANLFNQTFDYLIKNPGIINTHEYVLKAEEYKIPVINEVELAYALFPEDITIIAITGSNGKTTTTTIIYEILKKAELDVYLMGNIGYPVCSFIDRIKPGAILVIEISVQQLCNLKALRPHIAVLTNLEEAHLDFVGNYENYINIKKRIFNQQTESDYAILNGGDPTVLNMAPSLKAKQELFAREKREEALCYLKDNNIYYKEELIIPASKIKLRGVHNYENIMAALLVVKHLGIFTKIIQPVLSSFAGVPHRLEYVTEFKGVTFYNDAKATNIKATEIALSSFTQPLILLLGGYERGHSFWGLKDYLSNVKLIIGYGATKERIKDFAGAVGVSCLITDTLEEATRTAFTHAERGDYILLSPACASWDQFKNFEERGCKFKEYIENIIKEG